MPRAPRSSIAAATRLVAGGSLIIGVLLLAGCGTPPELREPRLEPYTPPPTTAGAPSTPPAFPTLAPATDEPLPDETTPAFTEATAVDCGGKPTGAQVIDLLRRSPDLLSASAKANVTTGPLCAGDWQYTIIQVSSREPLQVVSKGSPGALTLVTAGTDVCSIEVRTAGPPAIQTRACTGGPIYNPGA